MLPLVVDKLIPMRPPWTFVFQKGANIYPKEGKKYKAC